MRKFLADMPLFVEVAKRKSFTRAADVLTVPLPTLSRRIAELERSLGARLFYRNSRKVEVTEAGKMFYERCESILSEAENAKEEIAHSQETVLGRIRLSLTPTLYFICMQGALCSFTEKYPGIEMNVNFFFQKVDFENCDLTIWSGPLPESSLKARKLLTSQMGLYAAPAFFAQRVPPQEPQDLGGETFIQMKGYFENSLELRKGNQKKKVKIVPKHVVNNMGLSVEFLMAGQGIAVLHKQLAEKFEQVGALIHILPEWTCLGFETYLLRTGGVAPRRIQIFMDYLVEYFKTVDRSPPQRVRNSGEVRVECPLCSRCHKNGHSCSCRLARTGSAE